MNQGIVFVEEVEKKIKETSRSVDNYIIAWGLGMVSTATYLATSIAGGRTLSTFYEAQYKSSLEGSLISAFMTLLKFFLGISVFVLSIISIFRANGLLASMELKMTREERCGMGAIELSQIAKSLRSVFVVSLFATVMGMAMVRMYTMLMMVDIVLFFCAVIFRNKLKKFMIPEITG